MAKRRKEQEEDDQKDEETEKSKPKRAKLEVMKPTPKTHWLLHMKPFVELYHSVRTMVTRLRFPLPPSNPRLPSPLTTSTMVGDRWGDTASRQSSVSTGA